MTPLSFCTSAFMAELWCVFLNGESALECSLTKQKGDSRAGSCWYLQSVISLGSEPREGGSPVNGEQWGEGPQTVKMLPQHVNKVAE